VRKRGATGHRPHIRIRLRGLVAVLFAVALIAPVNSAHSIPILGDPPAPPPGKNVVTIVVDDMDDFSCSATAKYLPESAPWLSGQGVCFENATSPNPVCCPARAVIQSGQLPHNNRVRRQSEAKRFHYRRSSQFVLGNEGLRTSAVGKLFNGVKVKDLASVNRNGVRSGSFVTGFDEYSIWDSYDYREFGVKNERASFRWYIGEHTTTVTGALARGYIEDALDAGQPFYSYQAYYAPHDQVRKKGVHRFPSPTRAHRNAKVAPFKYRPERDARDKRGLFQGTGKRERFDRAYFAAKDRARKRALLDVDHEVAQTFRLLAKRGVLERTIVILVSDNGYHLGQQNWNSKAVPYNSSLDVPMYARGLSGLERGSVVTKQVSLADIAPTLYREFGVNDPGYVVDGHALNGSHKRRYVAFEHEAEHGKLVTSESGERTARLPAWRAIRMRHFKYIEWYDRRGRVRFREFYASPGEERNLLYYHPKNPPHRAVLFKMRRLLQNTSGCAGTVEQGSRHPCS